MKKRWQKRSLPRQKVPKEKVWDVPPINVYESIEQYPDDLIGIAFDDPNMLSKVQAAWNEAHAKKIPYNKIHPFVLFCDCTTLDEQWKNKIQQHCNKEGFEAHIDFSSRTNTWIWHSLSYQVDDETATFVKKNRHGIPIYEVLHEPYQRKISLLMLPERANKLKE